MRTTAALALAGTLGLVGDIAAGGGAGLSPAAAAVAAYGASTLLGRERLRRRLIRASRQRDEHLARTVHELRTPLTSVLSALELVRSGYANSPAEVAEFLDEAALAARHLSFLVNDVLDAAALESGQLRLDIKVHGVADILADARRMLTLPAARRGIELQIGSIPSNWQVRTDARRCLQVLFNLIGNAVKFSTPGCSVQVRVEPIAALDRAAAQGSRCARADIEGRDGRFSSGGPNPPSNQDLNRPANCCATRDFGGLGPIAAMAATEPRLHDGSMRFLVVDEGPGVPPSARARLFSPFHQADACSREGTGLGLHVTRRLVRQLGGEVGYQPGTPCGSVFWFELPRGPVEPPAPQVSKAKAKCVASP